MIKLEADKVFVIKALVMPPERGMSGLDKAKYILFGRATQNATYIWQDREVRFDSPVSALNCRPGETVIDSMVQLRLWHASSS